MPTAAILGTAGYTGPGDARPACSAIPELELVALGSDSLAGQPGARRSTRGLNGALPAFVHERRGGGERRRRDLPLPRQRARRRRSSRRTTGVVVDLVRRAPARRRRRSPSEWYGLDARAPWCYGLPEVHAAEGRLIANPGCYATAALLALAPLRDVVDRRRRRRREVGHDRRGPGARARRSHAGVVLENFSPYAIGRHRHAPEIEQVLGFAPCVRARTCCRSAAGLLATCYVRDRRRRRARAARGGVRRQPGRAGAARGRRAGDRRACREPTRAEIGVFADRPTGTAIVICAIDNLGKGAAGQADAEREPRARPARDGRACASTGCCV